MISKQIKMKRVKKMEMAKVNVIGKRGVQGEEDKEPERKDFMEFNLQKESVADVDDKSRVWGWGVWGGMGQLLACNENLNKNRNKIKKESIAWIFRSGNKYLRHSNVEKIKTIS